MNNNNNALNILNNNANNGANGNNRGNNDDRNEEVCEIYYDTRYGSKEILSYRCTKSDLLSKIEKSTSVKAYDFKDELFPLLPEYVKSLQITGPSVKTIVGFPKSLEALFIECQNLDESSLPPLPNSLLYLEMRHCNLTSVPNLPGSIKDIDLQDNQIKELPPTLPPTLETMNFDNNEITKLPPFPPKFQEGNFWGNPIQTIPRIPDSKPLLILSEDSLKEPFKAIMKKYYTLYNSSNFTPAIEYLYTAVNEYYDLLEKAKNTQAVQLVSKDGSFTRKRANGTEQYIPDIATVVGSYLSGEKGTLQQQMTKLKSKVPQGGKRKKTRKGGKSKKQKRGVGRKN